jgi:DNA-binding winged helix-turn-helix (wHTH) protein
MTDSLKFGRFRYDPARSLLLSDGEAVSLGGRAQRLLALLLARRGEIVAKSDLIDAAWPGEAIEDSNLSVQIAKLRRLIGAERIRTIERVGYQFLREPGDAAQPGRPTLAIHPFAAGEGCADIAAAIVDDIVSAVAPFGAVGVVASRSGAAGYTLEGSVRRNDGRAVLAIRLIEQRNGTYRWAERFEMKGPVSALVSRIASTTVAEIELAEMTRAKGPADGPEDGPMLYRRAQKLLRTSRPEDYAAAARLLERAIALDEDNPRYLAAMCDALSHRIGMGWQPLTNNDAERCAEHALRGLEMPDADADALALFGVAIYRAGDHDMGHAVMQRAAARNPNSLTALVYAATSNMHWGRLDEAEAQLNHGLGLAASDPAQGFVTGCLSRISMMHGRFEEAVAWATRAVAINPNYGGTHWTLVSATAQLGHDGAASRYLERFRGIHPGVTVMSVRTGQPTRTGRMASTLEGLERAGLAVG